MIETPTHFSFFLYLPADVRSLLQVMSIKEALYAREGISVAQIRLISGGKQLNDTDTVSSSKIKAGETIHMVLSLRGGSF